ncbi:MAG: hypothetical protein NTW21_16265 [Verrucomicrobia bacterium]|nr:hypothetical protein [Verrucomicrobiota bacterium]
MKSESHRFLTTLLLAGLALGSPLRAQQAEVALKLDFVAWGDAIGGLSLKAGDSGGITALPFRYSDPVTYSGPAVMEIFKSGDNNAKARPQPTADDKLHELIPLAPEPANPANNQDARAKSALTLELEKRRAKQPNLVALAVIPADCTRATVLLAPLGNGTYQAYVIDDDPTKLPLGEVRVHNLSTYEVAVRCSSGVTKTLKTRDSFVARAPDGYFIYELTYFQDEEWKYQENNVIPIRPTDQSQMIILSSDNAFFRSGDGSKNGFLQIVTLRRYPKSPPKPPK